MRTRHALVLGFVGACSAAAVDDRPAFVIDALTRDNQRWLDRDPAAVAAKYRVMAARRFDFLRGSAGLYWRDVTAAGAGARPSPFAAADGAWLWIVGDPHLENLGTRRRADGAVYVDWNDYDAATRGPWWLDGRRLALGLALAAADAGLPALASRLIDVAAHAYAGELVRLADGGPIALERGGAVIADLCARAATAGDAGARLADYTRLDAAGRRGMYYGDVVPPAADGTWIDTTVAVTAAERPDVDTAIATWRRTALVPAGALLGASRRLGAGVASYPAPRYYALLAGASDRLDDDLLIELKEAVAPAGMPSAPAAVALGLAEGDRTVVAERALAASPDDDVLLGGATVGPRSYRVRSRSGYERGVDLDDLAGDAAGLEELAAVAGRALARAHGRAPTVDGTPAAAVIAPRLRGQADALTATWQRDATDDAARVSADHAAFVDALARDPLLGGAP